MSRKKQSKALFEVLSSGKSKSLGVPGWFGQKKPAEPTPPRPPTEAAAPHPQAPPPRPAEPRTMTAAPSQPSARPLRTRAVVSAGNRVTFSLGPIGLAVTIGVAIGLLLLGFWVGRRTAATGPVEPQDQSLSREQDGTGVQQGAPGRPGVGPLRRPDGVSGDVGTAGIGLPTDNAPRQKGVSYLVIQGGIQNYDDAVSIQRFLRDRGVDTTVNRLGQTGMYIVWDLKGWTNIRDPEVERQTKQYVRQIERLGSLYQERGGRYNFRQSSQTGPWMLTEK